MTAPSSRGFGWLIEGPGEHDALVGLDGVPMGRNRDASEDLLAGAVPVPDEFTRLVQSLPLFKDQDDTNTCVVHAIFNIAEATLKAQGGPSVEPSSVPQVYATANQLLAAPDEALKDIGTFGRIAMLVCKDWGVARDADYRFRDPRTNKIIAGIVTTRPPPHVHQRASSWKLDEQLTLYATGEERLRTVDQVLAAMSGIPAAGVVDAAFVNYTGRGVLGPPNLANARGRHMVAIIGYRTNKTTKQREYLIRNSWRGWGLVIGTHPSLAWVSSGWVLAQEELYRLRVSRGRRTS